MSWNICPKKSSIGVILMVMQALKKKGKYKETEWILCDRFLSYALGGGYVLSKDLIIYLVKNQDYLSYVDHI